MKTPMEVSREFWRARLLAGGFTAIARWTLHASAGVANHEVVVPDALAASLHLWANELKAPLSAILLAAHAKVLASLSGEREVVTGYVAAAGRQALPCALTTEAETWRAILLDAQQREADLLSHQDFDVNDLRRQLHLSGPAFETEFDLFDEQRDLAPDTVLRLGVLQRDGRITLRVSYRTELMDADYATRLAGYHLRALELFAADPGSEHRRLGLLSARELSFQLDGLAGPQRALPELRFHELFEQRVMAHPEAIAAEHAGQQWTYRELNARANQLGHALLARGLARENVVAVVTERNLDWMASVIAIFKAGGVYLPIEPHFPADRIATTLARADCSIVLTEQASTGTLDRALESRPKVHKLFIDALYAEGQAGSNLKVEVAPDQLAYIYFTSGSTGEPKGAMCEHEGMVNHLYAKIEDLGVGEGEVVAQIAPQCFDISLWQLVSALLVGGRTLLIEQAEILDVERFVDQIVKGKVGVLQVVPSYLAVVVSYLERHPRKLPDLHCVSVTGEALTMELTRGWFAVKPEIKLANAYGLTETSDDTNHEVMDRVPDGERVPLGRPVRNVHVYVVDEHLAPVPLGAPGEIVFSGICVGRGYINDAERTRLAFMSDPHRQGQRLYRTGDHGRWLPDGKLVYLGRRDSQVKIRGFRIEIGEIENTLLRVPGVHQAAVVIAGTADASKRLVAFYCGAQLPADDMRSRLGASLPDYMVPSALHWQEELPLTANGKINKKALKALAEEEPDTLGQDFHAPTTAAEHRLAAAWAAVLGIPQDQIGRRDHFFDRGGTSLSAVKLVIALQRAVSLKDVTRQPVLADMAQLIGARTERRGGLLQSLAEAAPEQTGALVCFPYAGGNAVNFQPLAKALRGSGLAVYAVELPGHDLSSQVEPFAPLVKVVEQVAAEIAALAPNRILLWGHSSGTAFAALTARKLMERGLKVERLFLAAHLLGDAAELRASAAQLSRLSNTELAAGLRANSGLAEFGELEPARAEHMGAAYRHDLGCASHYWADAVENPPTVKLSTPVTVVVAADDPRTPDYGLRYRDWQVLADAVDLHVLADGGHYFLRTRPAETAKAVLQAAAAPAQTTTHD